MIEKVAPSDATVMLLGESGTGKEVLATGLHNASRRKGKFVAINCAAIPENLLESELFGYERGAFTGATKTTVGKIETAHGGTLMLDEIGDLPMPLQAKLLRFLQERKIERLGGRRHLPGDAAPVAVRALDPEQVQPLPTVLARHRLRRVPVELVRVPQPHVGRAGEAGDKPAAGQGVPGQRGLGPYVVQLLVARHVPAVRQAECRRRVERQGVLDREAELALGVVVAPPDRDPDEPGHAVAPLLLPPVREHEPRQVVRGVAEHGPEQRQGGRVGRGVGGHGNP